MSDANPELDSISLRPLSKSKLKYINMTYYIHLLLPLIFKDFDLPFYLNFISEFRLLLSWYIYFPN
jgi:hypothetical protein